MNEETIGTPRHTSNPNVKLSLWWTLLETGSQSIRSGDILSAYVYLSRGSNSEVGYIQGVNGVMQMIASIPAGWLADYYRRDTILRISAVIGAIGGISLGVALALKAGIWPIMGAMAMLGIYKGVYTPPSEAIFSDSVPTGKSSIYTKRYIWTQFASIFGPLLSVVMFLFLGNKWQIADCRTVVLFGLVLMVLPLAVMCFFDDDKTLGSRSEAITPSPSMNRIRSVASLANLLAHGEDDELPPGCLGTLLSYCVPSVLIPSLIVFSDFIGALASGMTVKFFPLFFMQRVSLAPVAVSLLGVMGPLAVSAASKAAEYLAKIFGRVQVTLVFRAVDIILLVLMAYLPQEVTWARDLLVGTHIIRTASANSGRPLLRSVLMDHVPKKHRARVSALESVRSCSWSGSAVLGGILIEMYDFQVTFLITAAVKALSFAPLLLLLCLLEQEQKDMAGGPDVEALQAGLLSPSADSESRSEDDIQQDHGPPMLPGKGRWHRAVKLDWQTPEVNVLGEASPETCSSSGAPSMCSDHNSEAGSVPRNTDSWTMNEQK